MGAQMSSTPTIERAALAPSTDWVDIVPPRNAARLTSASVLIAISRARMGMDDGIVIDTDALRPVDSADIDAAHLADDRWDS